MVNFRGKEYFDERQVVEVLLEENEQLKAKIVEQGEYSTLLIRC